ncbi:MAG: TetR/AcrR family transcriptional regulator [Melioribacteraceae bacterium]|nr:TetR/AcrR family transcriptional regulator [Melioribacteraceae bacterium]MCF8264491.1 TetR/AcrR family transcriptional regulator [Melioribacteraceae bacterium]MCF8411922.1 TetR/AcrR family transcriptional regulator [Melioribacteraceae bacterium]MCF8430943.1 TetR/AcrR family transcriptional regulator [Melioribacteraceae bacterium]
MRIKDEAKQSAIIDATVKLVNEIGFVSSSVSKIAKEANVSPATLYIYYKNKEDLLVSTYLEIKQRLSEEILSEFNQNAPIRDSLYKFWTNAFHFISQNNSYFQYTEQFANSPYSEKVNHEDVEKSFTPIYEVLQKGIEQKIIKNVSFEILSVFMFYPIMNLSNARLCKNITADSKTIEDAFQLAWDAIKL